MPQPLELTVQDGLAVMALNQPERANVLDAAMEKALAQAVRDLQQGAAQGSVRAVLLHGRGAHFCAGGDISEFVQAGDRMAELLEAGVAAMHASILALARLPVPVVSALNGSVGGGGIGLALCADIVLAAQSMKLRGGYSAIGLTPDLGSSWALTRLVGPMRASHILLTNRPWTAQQCLAAGLVAEVHPDAELLPAATAMASALARGAPRAQARIKRLIAAAGEHPLEDHLLLEKRFMVESGGESDAREGVRAFLEKRPPRFG